MNHFKSISDLHKNNGYPPPEHPMLSILTCQELTTCSWGGKFTTDFYMISLKKIRSGTFMYGKTRYDHENGSMSFVKPRQVVEINNVELSEKAFVIFVHEDYLSGNPLHNEIKKYGYFDYEINEALHLSPAEEQIMWELYDKIALEYRGNQDEFSKDIILTHFDSILKYAQRFYKRQFINRTVLAGSMVSKFNDALNSYFEEGKLQKEGLPTVTVMASQLNTSARYLSDLLKQETGKTALDHIHIYLIDEAKNLLLSSDNTIAETAYQLGFENPPYFTRLFKKEVGITPNEYRFKSMSLN
ncbi:MAG: helix-turn-helix transcriptional regulator [Bacteroidota bacterium]